MAYSFLPTEIVTVIEQHTWRNYEILLRWRHTVGWHVLLYSCRTPVEKLPNFTHKRRESFFQQSSHQARKCEYSLNVSCKHQNITLLSCLRSNFKRPKFRKSPLSTATCLDNAASQHIPLCRLMWLLNPKVEAQTHPHILYRLIPAAKLLSLGCWCLHTRFASATSICWCSNVASPIVPNYRPFVSVPGQFLKSAVRGPYLLKEVVM